MKGEDNIDLSSIIKQNEGLIYSIINKYSNYYEMEDLYQVASIGLIKAYKKYESDRNSKFTTFAYTYIFGEVYKYVNDNRNFKFNRELLSLGKKVNEAKTILTQKLMKEPTIKELSLFLEIDESLIGDVTNLNNKLESLDQVIAEDSKNLYLYDLLSSKKTENQIDNIFLHQEIDKLSEEEKMLLNMRYFNDKTQTEVAEYFGINQVQVSRNEKKVLCKLRKNMSYNS